MPGNTEATLYIGNLDERVDERVLYEIMVQAGPLVEVYIPRDKETKRHKGYAFAEYTTEQSAQYALSLFSGLLSLYNRSLRLAISGGDRSAQPSQITSAADNALQRSLSSQKPQQIMEETGPVTPSRMQEDIGYQQPAYFQMHSPIHPSTSPSTPSFCPWSSGVSRSAFGGDGTDCRLQQSMY